MLAVALKWGHGKVAEKIIVKEQKKFPVSYHLQQNMVHDFGDRAREMELFCNLCVLENPGLPYVGKAGKVPGLAWNGCPKKEPLRGTSFY